MLHPARSLAVAWIQPRGSTPGSASLAFVRLIRRDQQLKLSGLSRNVVLNDIPDDGEAHFIIAVNQAIAHIGHLLPGNIWMCRTEFRRYPSGCFPNDFYPPDDSILAQCVLLEHRAINASHIRLNMAGSNERIQHIREITQHCRPSSPTPESLCDAGSWGYARCSGDPPGLPGDPTELRFPAASD